jgi:hypothetical protein
MFRAAVGNAGVQVFRPGDVVLDTDPDFAAIVAAAPSPAGLATFPLAPALATAATTGIAERLRAVPDDVVQNQLLAAAV